MKAIIMVTCKNSISTGNFFSDIVNLPMKAQQELFVFYEFLMFKYQKQKKLIQNDKKSILSAIFQEADGKLPPNYSLNREVLHER
ncbi:MAG: hypothetical protein OMM_09531 [Candidatus Magnetoglobus multicellularis str. Araruama]|uniref:Uncharacterized protein n=1 Tax=Candidatus Magnetoglobus multicellularis str. Araruama TaxID=890399 RepID=A0A1V1P437_9BACT|nr:MAG: hypothetical protein OMM_09531 [Candidatus Magnetoglobus multicellularis str. Araruama]